MEDILHYLGCIKPCKEWDKLPAVPACAGFFPSTLLGIFLSCIFYLMIFDVHLQSHIFFLCFVCGPSKANTSIWTRRIY